MKRDNGRVQVQATVAALSPTRRRLVELMRRLHFGRIEGLAVRGGEPVFEPPPRLVRDRKLGSEDEGRPPTGHDFGLKQQVLDLFAVLDDLGDGVIDLIDVKHGLPFRALFEEPAP